MPTCRSVGSLQTRSRRSDRGAPARRSCAADVLGLLVGHDDQPHPHRVLLGEIADARTSWPPARPSCRRRRGRTSGHPRCGARTAPGRPGTTSRWPWKIRRSGRSPGPTDRAERVQIAELVVDDRDLARLQPPLDEPGSRAQAVDVGRVVGDQALGERALVHPREGSGAPPPRSASSGGLSRARSGCRRRGSPCPPSTTRRLIERPPEVAKTPGTSCALAAHPGRRGRRHASGARRGAAAGRGPGRTARCAPAGRR